MPDSAKKTAQPEPVANLEDAPILAVEAGTATDSTSTKLDLSQWRARWLQFCGLLRAGLGTAQRLMDWLFTQLQVTQLAIFAFRGFGLCVALASPIWPLVVVDQIGLWGWLLEILSNVGIGIAFMSLAELMHKVELLANDAAGSQGSNDY